MDELRWIAPTVPVERIKDSAQATKQDDIVPRRCLHRTLLQHRRVPRAGRLHGRRASERKSVFVGCLFRPSVNVPTGGGRLRNKPDAIGSHIDGR